MVSADRALVIAPHVDDELIGCFSILVQWPTGSVDVLYLYELTPLRRLEAEAAGRAMGFNVLFDQSVAAPLVYEEVFVPCRQDTHPDHRAANTRFRSIATYFYSVSMQGDGVRYLGAEVAERKRACLEICYPSQAPLWRNDARYWMFERIVGQDFDCYRTIPCKGWGKVTVLERYAESVIPWLLESGERGDIEVFNELVAQCPEGRVTLELTSGTIYSI